MMNVSEYASDVGVTVKEILELCNKLDIKVSKEDDMLSDDDIIILDNELASIQPSEESTEELEELEELEDIEESYEEQIKEENKAKKKKTAKPTNKNDFKEKRKEKNAFYGNFAKGVWAVFIESELYAQLRAWCDCISNCWCCHAF